MDGYIGLSLSNCIRDIAWGRVSIGNVKFILSGTAINNRDDMLNVISGYSDSYWHEIPIHKIIHLLETLVYSGRIIQPRVLGIISPNISEGHWVKCNVEDVMEMVSVFYRRERLVL